jgi:hypothetical protein
VPPCDPTMQRALQMYRYVQSPWFKGEKKNTCRWRRKGACLWYKILVLLVFFLILQHQSRQWFVYNKRQLDAIVPQSTACLPVTAAGCDRKKIQVYIGPRFVTSQRGGAARSRSGRGGCCQACGIGSRGTLYRPERSGYRHRGHGCPLQTPGEYMLGDMSAGRQTPTVVSEDGVRVL